MRLIFKQVNSEKSTLTSIMWVDLIPSVEPMNRTKRLASLSKRKFHWVSSLPDFTANFGLTSLHNLVSQFLITNFLHCLHVSFSLNTICTTSGSLLRVKTYFIYILCWGTEHLYGHISRNTMQLFPPKYGTLREQAY